MANLSLEGLVNSTEDGRPRPFLAESWITAPDGLSLTLQLRPTAKFQDGTPVTAPIIAQALQQILPSQMGPAFEDVDRIVALDDTHLQIHLRQQSQFLIEALEAAIQKPGSPGIGTGPYMVSDVATPSELLANSAYHEGRPTIGRIALTPYPSVRAAWADLLRGNLDMLYEVNVDALDSLQGSSDVTVFSFARPYQYVIIFGSRAPQLASAAVRRALNGAIDRGAVVSGALNGHGIPSTGPVPPKHWALEKDAPKLSFDAKLAASLAGRPLTFTCLVPADSVYERLALIVKQQLAAASVDMRVEEATQDRIIQAATNNTYEAMMLDMVSGPTLFRAYRQLHSKVPFAAKPMGSPAIDAALDRVRRAPSDDEYRAGVTALQGAVVEAPPAIYLAWSERARAVSRRFDVSAPESGRDILSTLRLWRPTPNQQTASRN